jgi:hypothetical protein
LMVQLFNPLIFAGNLRGAEVRRRWRHTMIEWSEHELLSIKHQDCTAHGRQ